MYDTKGLKKTLWYGLGPKRHQDDTIQLSNSNAISTTHVPVHHMYVPKQSFTDQRRSSRVMHDLDFAILHMLMNCCCCCSIYISRNIAVLTLRYSVTIAPILRDHFCPTMVDVTDFLMSKYSGQFILS